MSDTPSSRPRPEGELHALQLAWMRPRGWRQLTVVNNTWIGLLYIGTALAFFVLAGLLALGMRLQLASPEGGWLSVGLYNQFFTMHGTVMMFLFAVPVVEAVAVYLLPGMLGARDLPFPRLGAYAFWAYAIGSVAFFMTLFFGVAPDGGWFMYPPLTSTPHSPGLGADFWLLGIGFIEISAIAGAVEMIIGVLMTRAPGMTLQRMPVFAWAMLVVGLMIVLAFPPVIAGTALLEMERAFDWPFFLPDRGGDPLLWQHLFWFFGHPEVYIIFLPAAGLVSMMVPALSGTPLVGYRAVVAALACVGALSFLLWVHHMFTAGLGRGTATLVSALSLAITIPGAVQLFAWIATIRRGGLRWHVPGLFLLAFFVTFGIGGLTGVMVAVLPLDGQVHDSYFVVAHLHYVLVGGMVFPVFAAFYHWAPLVHGHSLPEASGRWVAGLMFVGFHLAFFPMHLLGLEGMPRRVAAYGADAQWMPWNLLSTVGAFVLAGGVLLFLVDVLRWARRPSTPLGNPWRSPGLEWLGSQAYGVRSIPQVRSRYPLWDQPELAEEVPQGAHWLPGTATGGRETLVTHPVTAQPSYVLHLPGPSWLPLIAAAGTAAFFLLLTVKLLVLAAMAGVVTVACLVRWLWEGEARRRPGSQVDVADGVRLPLGASGPSAHSWWAMVIVLGVDATLFLSFAFAHLHVAMAATVCPPPGASLPAGSWTGAACALAILASLATARASAAVRHGTDAARPWAMALAVVAQLAGAAAWAALLAGHGLAGLRPSADAWSATIAALLAFGGLHLLFSLAMTAYIGAVWLRWRSLRVSRVSWANIALFQHATMAQVILVAVLPAMVARLG